MWLLLIIAQPQHIFDTPIWSLIHQTNLTAVFYIVTFLMQLMLVVHSSVAIVGYEE